MGLSEDHLIGSGQMGEQFVREGMMSTIWIAFEIKEYWPEWGEKVNIFGVGDDVEKIKKGISELPQIGPIEWFEENGATYGKYKVKSVSWDLIQIKPMELNQFSWDAYNAIFD